MDAGNASMKDGGRVVWAKEDRDRAAQEHERFTLACYGYRDDEEGSHRPFLRLQVAESLEQQGLFNLTSDMDVVYAVIDGFIAGEVSQSLLDKIAA